MLPSRQGRKKLLRKERVSSRLKRVYGAPQTPLDRLRAGKGFVRATVNALLVRRATTDPFELDRIATLARA